MEATKVQEQEKTFHEIITELRGGDDSYKIFDPKLAEDILRKAVDVLGLPRAMVVLSSRERNLISAEARKEIFNSGRRTDIDPDDIIRRWINTPENHYQIFTVAEFAEKMGVTGGQLRTFMKNFGWRFKKADGRKYEIRPDERK